MTDENETDTPPVETVKETVVEKPAETVEEVVPHPDAPPSHESVHEHLCPECVAKVVDAIASASPVPEVEEVLDPDETPTKAPWTHRKLFG